MKAEAVGNIVIGSLICLVVLTTVVLLLMGKWKPTNAELMRLRPVFYLLLLIVVLWRTVCFSLHHHH